MDLPTLMLISAVMIIIGVGLGFVLSMFRTSPASTQPRLETEPDRGRDRVLTIWRDRQSATISVQIDGQTIISHSDLTPDFREQLALRLEMLQSWLEDEKSQYARAETSHPMQGRTSVNVSGAGPAPAHGQSPNSGAERDRVGGLNPVAIFARALTTEVRKPQPVQSLASQIDAILQERLENSPLSARGIRLQEHPQQGLVVQVGLNKYNSIDEVPDEEIRTFIRDAIAEWEKQAGVG
jgi:hypothetical protein